MVIIHCKVCKADSNCTGNMCMLISFYFFFFFFFFFFFLQADLKSYQLRCEDVDRLKAEKAQTLTQ